MVKRKHTVPVWVSWVVIGLRAAAALVVLIRALTG